MEIFEYFTLMRLPAPPLLADTGCASSRKAVSEMRHAVYKLLFEITWGWVRLRPGRLLPIGERGRRILWDVWKWSRGY